ncbi:MAG: hypothetical protein AAFQ22_16005, partial [Pseudomonadota bacterium]
MWLKIGLIGGLTAVFAAPAVAKGPSVYLDIAAGSALIDRGEELAETVVETAIGVEQAFGTGTVFAEIYRISPVGGDNDAFAEEVDFAAGYSFEAGGQDITLGAAYLTFPGAGEDNSLELTGEIAFNGAFSPLIFGFYDADFEIYGFEASAGPSWDVGNWEAYALARLGTVQPDEDASWTYYGAEVGAA